MGSLLLVLDWSIHQKSRKALKNMPQKVKKGLHAVLGKGVYRTYRLDRMEFCWNINLTQAQKAIAEREKRENATPR